MVNPVNRDSHIEGNTHCNTASPAIPSKAHNTLGPGRTRAAASQNPDAELAFALGNAECVRRELRGPGSRVAG